MLKLIKKWSGRFKGELLFMCANYLTPIVGFLASIVAARFVAPAEMGAIQTALLFVPYLAMLHFGVFTGLARNLAYYLGKGEEEKAMRMVSASAFVAKINTGIGLIFGLGFIAVQLSTENPNRIVIIAGIAMTISLVCMPFINQISIKNRSGQHFKEFGKVVFSVNLLRSIYLFLPALLGWIGHVISLGLQPIIRLTLLKRKEPYPVRVPFFRSDLTELIKVGFPIMANGYISGLLLVADQSLVALFMTKEKLGYFALARLVVMTIMIIPATLSILLSPKVAACYGRTHDPHALRRFFWIILGIHAAFIIPFCIISYFAVGPIVEGLLPKYIPGIGVAKITILTCLGYIFSGLLIISSTLRKNIIPILFYFIAWSAMWIGGYILFHRNTPPNMEQIAWLRFYISMLLSIATLIYVYYTTRRKKEF